MERSRVKKFEEREREKERKESEIEKRKKERKRREKRSERNLSNGSKKKTSLLVFFKFEKIFLKNSKVKR